MNPDAPRTAQEELEIRITALLMGELPPDEAAALLAQIVADPELTALHARLRHAVDLLREARTLPEQPAPEIPLQLSKERRAELLAKFRGLKPMPPLKSVPTPKLLPSPRAILALPQKKKRDWKWVVPLGIAASAVFIVGGTLFFPQFSTMRSQVAIRDAESHDFTDEESILSLKAEPSFSLFSWGEQRDESTRSNASDKFARSAGADVSGPAGGSGKNALAKSWTSDADRRTASLSEGRKLAETTQAPQRASGLYLPSVTPESEHMPSGPQTRFGTNAPSAATNWAFNGKSQANSGQTALPLAASQPTAGEYQRFPGHPATTTLSPILRSQFGSGSDRNALYTLAPRIYGGVGSTMEAAAEESKPQPLRGRDGLAPVNGEPQAADEAKSSGAIANNLSALDKLSDLSSSIPREKEARAATGKAALGRSEVAAVNGAFMFDTDGSVAASDFAIVPPTSGPAGAPQPTNAPAPVAALGDAANDMDVSAPFSTAGRVTLGKKLNAWVDNSEIAPAPKPRVELGYIGDKLAVQDGRAAGAIPALPTPAPVIADPTPAPDRPISLATAAGGVELTGERDLQRRMKVPNDSWKSSMGGGGAAIDSKAKVAAQKPGTDDFYRETDESRANGRAWGEGRKDLHEQNQKSERLDLADGPASMYRLTAPENTVTEFRRKSLGEDKNAVVDAEYSDPSLGNVKAEALEQKARRFDVADGGITNREGKDAEANDVKFGELAYSGARAQALSEVSSEWARPYRRFDKKTIERADKAEAKVTDSDADRGITNREGKVSEIPYFRGADGYEEVSQGSIAAKTKSENESDQKQTQWFGRTSGGFAVGPQPVARPGAVAAQSGPEKAQPGQPDDAPENFANGIAYFAKPTLDVAGKSDPGAVGKDGEKKDTDQRGLGTITVSGGALAQIATANDAAPTPEKVESLARFRAIAPQEKPVAAQTGPVAFEQAELSKSLADSAKKMPDVTLDDAIDLKLTPDVAEFEGFVNHGAPLQKAGNGTLNFTGAARGAEPLSDSSGKDAVRLQVEKGKKAYGLQPDFGGEQKLEENVSARQLATGTFQLPTIVNGGDLAGLAVDGKPAGGAKPEDQLKKKDSKRASKTERVEELEKLAEVQAQLAPAIPPVPEMPASATPAKPATATPPPAAEPPAPPKAAEPPPVPQPEVATAENAFSTFSLNVSDVSFKLAGVSLEKGTMPDPASVRSEEFINALDYRDPEPAAGAPLAFASERARYPFAHNRDLLRISVKTAAAGRQPGRPLNLVLLLDNSGSMERADRVRILKESLSVLSKQLQPQDKLSIITFSRTPRLWADGVTGDKAAEFTNRVGEITPQGGTDLGAAMDLGYQTALKHYQVGSVNRVVLLTDGAANLGNVNPETLKQKVESHRKQGVAFDCFGVGWEGYNDDLLEQLSRNGDGRYGFINTPEAAATEFAEQLAGALRVAASDVKVQVEFNPKRVTSYRQLGYAKHQLKKEQFRDNTVDAAEIGAAESGNALYTVEVNPRGQGDIATVRVRFKVPGTNDYREHEWAVPFTAPAPALEQSGTSLRLAATTAAFSEWLAQSPFAGDVTTDRLLGMINGIPAIYGADPRPSRLEWMIRQAKSISGR